ncbi:MAG: lycopene beta-cyclase CrtY [Candidatus Wenzhouxiangella sp. M2_3B_020]
MPAPNTQLLLAGGGLAACLIALRLRATHPDTAVTIVEAGARPGGNHTWSVHDTDLTGDQHALLAPAVRRRWPAQQVRFPAYSRTLDCGYRSITSDALADLVETCDGIEVRAGTRIADLAPDHAVTDSGERLNAYAVIDARGPGDADGMVLGFQKFVGHEVRTAEPHGVELPIIMDATVSQSDGYRFVYVLPFDERTLLIEDTRYSDGAELSREELAGAIDAYAAERGWSIAERVRAEDGVLPILMAGDFDRFWPADPERPARAGLRAGLFHPTTGYSLPQAAALADAVAAAWPMTGTELATMTRGFAGRFWLETRFFRLLNRMLFRAGRPEHRYRVLERFYTLSESLVTNFYAGRLTLSQKARILAGKPPVPVAEALPLLRERPFMNTT